MHHLSQRLNLVCLVRRPVIGWKNYSSLLLVPEVGNVVEDVAAGAGRGGAHAEGVEIEVESSEATPRQGTIYRKRVRSSGGGGASGTRQSPEFQHVQGGSWTTHNPACDDLPHAPHLTLTQGSRMTDLSNCREFYPLCLPQLKGCSRKTATRWIFWMITSMLAAEREASEILVEEATADCKWLLTRDVPLIADHIVKSDELAKYMFELGEAAYNNGRMDGYSEGRAAVVANEKVDHFDLYKTDCDARYASKRQEYEFLEFAIVKAVGKLSRKTDAVEVLKKALGDQDPEAGGAGSSHQV
ncbi:hypothetical protein Hdeb2414_s0018g00527151 [Helianthus debilis subsp. tardiflorus]